MNNNIFPFLALTCLLAGGFLLSCSPKSGGPTQARNKMPEDVTAREVLSLLKEDIGNNYQSSENGQVDLEERSFVKVEALNESEYRHFEVYNVYEAENGTREYYISEFVFDTNDSVERQKIKDYQLVIKDDSVSEAEGNDYEFLIEVSQAYTLADQSYELYLLSNFGHVGAQQPDQYSVWSPSCGIVLSWYGDDRWFSLNQSDYLEEEALAFLRDNGREMIRDFSKDLDHSGHDHSGHDH
jgi:hypothetical protein